MSVSQTFAEFRSIYEKVQPYLRKEYTTELVRNSPVLSSLMKPIKYGSDGKPISGFETFSNRRQMIQFDTMFLNNTGSLGSYAIQYGDEIDPIGDKRFKEGYIDAVDKGMAMSITETDLQNLESSGSSGTGSRRNAIINWITKSWAMQKSKMATEFEYDVIAGTGTVTNTHGVRNTFYGLPTIIGTGSYANITTTDVPFWKSKTRDMNSDDLGYTASTSFGTIAYCTTVTTNMNTTPFYRYLNLVANMTLSWYNGNNPNAKLCIFMHPAVYDLLFLASLETQKYNRNNPPAGTSIDTTLAGYTIDYTMGPRLPIFRYDTFLPATDDGGSPTFLLPMDTIYMVNMDTMHFGISKSANFVESDWTKLPNAHGAYTKMMDVTSMFWCDDRRANTKIKIHDTTAAALATAYTNF